MHIGLLSPAWPPGSHPNGIVTYVDVLRRELMRQGHRVSVFTWMDGDRITDPGVHRIFPDFAGRVDRWIARLLGKSPTVFDVGETLASAIKRVDAREPLDVVEMEESFGWALDVYRRTSVPVVVKLHGPAFVTLMEEELGTSFGMEKVAREGHALKQLPVMTSPSESTLKETLARYQLTPVLAKRIANPVDTAANLPLWDVAHCDRDSLLFVGRFDKVKGGDVMIRAFQRLLEERPDCRLTFVGPDGGLVQRDGTSMHVREFISSLQDPKLERNLVYKGQLTREEVTALRTGSLVSVMTSRRENQPYSLLEAMLQACPVVCTDTSGLSEIVEHGATGLKARTEDPQDLATQMCRILDDPSLGRSLGLAGREYVLRHHAPAAVVAQTVDVYRQAIALQRSGAGARR